MKNSELNQEIPEPGPSETPVDYAYRIGKLYIEFKNASQKGQVFTPREISRFMAKLALKRVKASRILDPGAGTGILCCAVLEEMINQESANLVHIDTVENDITIRPYLLAVLSYAQEWCEERGMRIEYSMLNDDFINFGLDRIGLANHMDEENGMIPYDLIIMNPPYFKLRSQDHRIRVLSDIAGKQTNIYSLFLSVAALLLDSDGILVSINPRSFASGRYYQAFRNFFFQSVKLRAIHLFDSRKNIFADVDVLQETVIVVLQKSDQSANVEITASRGVADIDSPRRISIELGIILSAQKDKRLAIPTSLSDCRILDTVNSWTETLGSIGLEISTGPVVPFRARELLLHEPGERSENFAPLLWMNNVRIMDVTWPIGNHKHEFILVNNASQRLLVPSARYVLLRRFSTKEEKSRLVAAVTPDNIHESQFLGIENHLNFIHRDFAGLELNFATGLAVLLNSTIMDQYFRILNGNTQVNAYDVRLMPLPRQHLIERIGLTYLSREPESDAIQESIDSVVHTVLQ